MKYSTEKPLRLNVSPIAFHGKFRSDRESIKEITKITDGEVTYSNYHGESYVKKIVKNYQKHVFGYGRIPVYELEDGEKIEVYSFIWFDWRRYNVEQIDKERELRWERLMKEGIKIPLVKRTYPSLF